MHAYLSSFTLLLGPIAGDAWLALNDPHLILFPVASNWLLLVWLFARMMFGFEWSLI